MTIDHRSAQGLPGVPVAGGHPVRAGHPEFDEQYLVATADPVVAAALLTADLCDVMLRTPVQRLSFDGPRLVVRTFDGVQASPDVEMWLDGMAGAVLAATPGFIPRVTVDTAAKAAPQVFPPGLYGLDDPDDTRAGRLLTGWFTFPGRKRAY
jgi:hypothetical protein